MSFENLPLSPEIIRAVKEIGFESMTEIQEKSIPVILEGNDVIGRSNTGTGKTAAFGIPAVEQIDRDVQGVQVLILCPTRELASQACDEIKKFSRYKKQVRPVAVYGGVNIDRQIVQLKHGANIVIGTPGRVIDHINRRTIKLQNLRTIVLDEADEMLQMGFREDIEKILSNIPEERQTILFSATMPPEILAITKEYQHSPVLIKTISKSNTVEAIEQLYYHVPHSKKFDALVLLLKYYDYKSSMIFCNTKKMVDELTDMLTAKGFKAVGIHGDMKQNQRTMVMNSFKSGRTSILVATDVAARGIDVSGVDAVFNYDLPQDNEYYVHRIGRTGRAGRTGTAHTLAGNRMQVNELKGIARNTKSEIKESELPDKEHFINGKINDFIKSYDDRYSGEISAEANRLFELLRNSGKTSDEIALSLINEMFSAEICDIPDVTVIRSRGRDNDNKRDNSRQNRFNDNDRPRRGEKLSEISINLGRKQKIAPNYILGALVDATGMPGNSFGKINIHDNFTVVEVPKNKTDHIINAMKNGKIRGNKVTVTKREKKNRDNYNNSKNGRDGKRHSNGKNMNRRYRKSG